MQQSYYEGIMSSFRDTTSGASVGACVGVCHPEHSLDSISEYFL